MRSLLVLLAAVAAAAPAGAQIVGRHDYGDVRMPDRFIGDSRLRGPSIRRDLGDVHDRIDRARDAGTISRREARRLEREARLIGRLARRYGRDGLSRSEAAELRARTHYLRDAVQRPRPRRGG